MPKIKEKMKERKKNMHYSFVTNKICLPVLLVLPGLKLVLVINVLLSFSDSLIGIFLVCYLS